VNASTPIVEESRQKHRRAVMGRNMFGLSVVVPGARAVDGLVGCQPALPHPVFIPPITRVIRWRWRVDHVPLRQPTDRVRARTGQEGRQRQRRHAVGRRPNIAQQYLAAGLLDELELHVVPVLLGDGARLLDHLGTRKVRLEQVRAVEAPASPTSKYRILPGAPSRSR